MSKRPNVVRAVPFTNGVWRVAPPWREALERLGVSNCASASDCFFGAKLGPGGSRVIQKSLQSSGGPTALFIKEYSHTRPSWKFVGRASKAALEARNYAILESLGCRVPEVAFWGEERGIFFRLKRAIIATRAVPDSITLAEFLQNTTDATGPDTRHRARLLQELAGLLRAMHARSFFHHDLVGRNILVGTSRASPELWWIDCPRGGFFGWPLGRHRKRVRDLASLDKTGAQHCRRAERLRWLLQYLGISGLDEDAKRLIRDVTRYRLSH